MAEVRVRGVLHTISPVGGDAGQRRFGLMRIQAAFESFDRVSISSKSGVLVKVVQHLRSIY